ncbi:helix-turn-helix domain-containing protein [Oceanirhabdus sp. W0125-5]|uniref:helix-turn-helix domain-containing protein n=1 Tax=Oceanirhabdus sp. W0125-5 TaxID=2999116 RepID=UPI0022F2BDF0|nr:helix-turn-helix transcriptional regulator [Oceanirhabdus sp. W0125-5]WBW98285.1 helix-turn-helix transcriptional regulator [Oceanirhabdus sp. W0125-5]
MQVLGVGERLKYYRKFLKISQKELADNKVSSNLISLIERGRVPLSTVTASILVHNLNKISNEKKIYLNLSIRDLMMSDKEYITKICDERIKRVKTNHEIKGVYNDAIKMIGDVEELNTELEKYFGKIFFNKEEYRDSIVHLEKYLNSQLKKDDKELADVKYLVGKSYYKYGEYNQAIKMLLQSYEIIKHAQLTKKCYYDLIHTLTLASYKEHQYHIAKEFVELCIEFLEKEPNSYNKKNIYILKAEIYMKLNENDKALEIYKNIIQSSEDMDIIRSEIKIALDQNTSSDYEADKSFISLVKSLNFSNNYTNKLLKKDFIKEERSWEEQDFIYNDRSKIVKAFIDEMDSLNYGQKKSILIILDILESYIDNGEFDKVKHAANIMREKIK